MTLELTLAQFASRVETDVYFKKELERQIKSASCVGGVVRSEVKKLHTKDGKELFILTTFALLCGECGIFDLSKEDFMKYFSIIYDMQTQAKILMQHTHENEYRPKSHHTPL